MVGDDRSSPRFTTRRRERQRRLISSCGATFLPLNPIEMSVYQLMIKFAFFILSMAMVTTTSVERLADSPERPNCASKVSGVDRP